ncbi:MAG: PD-(D/E)XK nuclease family transposase, partial [Bacteroidales bacterium]|nr:PD-(D/E)XK nuclease family transposase [Bacteroidales bacterium]
MTNQRKNIFQIPTTDFSFKKIFGTEQNKRFLIRFLNCFVSKYTGEIVDVTYLPTEY